MNVAEIREIRPEEWQKLEPVFRAQGGRLPVPAQSTAAVAMDRDGNIVGFWALQRCWHAGPLWIHPDYRGTGLWRRLHARIVAMFAPKEGNGFYSFSGEPKVEHMFRELGYRDLGYKLWAREVK